MQLETLQFSSTTASPPIHLPKHHLLSSIPRPKHIHVPPNPKSPPTTTAITVPKHPSVHQQPSATTTPPPNPASQLQETILYLDSLGVDSLHCLNVYPQLLTAPLTQLKSTVNFLYSIGVTTHDLRRVFPMCPEILSSHFTVTAAVTFLLREAHVAASDLRHVIHRRPRLLISSVDRQLRPTLYFLQGTIGIEKIGAKLAPLLSCSVEKKFIPRIEYLQKLGFSYRDTISMFRRFPAMFCYGIKENFEPKFDYFVVEMGRELRELVEFPQYFSFSLENRIKPRHRICVEKGVCLALPTMLKLPERRFKERLGVCCDSSTPVRTSPLWRSSTMLPSAQRHSDSKNISPKRSEANESHT